MKPKAKNTQKFSRLKSEMWNPSIRTNPARMKVRNWRNKNWVISKVRFGNKCVIKMATRKPWLKRPKRGLRKMTTSLQSRLSRSNGKSVLLPRPRTSSKTSSEPWLISLFRTKVWFEKLPKESASPTPPLPGFWRGTGPQWAQSLRFVDLWEKKTANILRLLE